MAAPFARIDVNDIAAGNVMEVYFALTVYGAICAKYVTGLHYVHMVSKDIIVDHVKGRESVNTDDRNIIATIVAGKGYVSMVVAK